ncbi:MAG: hypothetical protein LCH56_16735 [Proteobacteria bacterium]|nr:hypothetical protein [Pseudomonadota bacterium]
MKHQTKLLTLALTSASALSAPVFAADGGTSPVQDRRIGYVMTSEYKAIWDTPDGKAECPQGINNGPREEFKILYPDDKKWTILESQLERESEVWFPKLTAQPKLPYYESVAKTSFGIDLNDKVDDNDYTDPDGNKGIDNQTQRAWGCTANYRSTSYNLGAFNNWRKYSYNIIVIELTDVDDLINDPDVTLTTYRGMDKPMTDATGATYLSGGTQRVDMRFGKSFIQKFKGKIVDGVLTTEGADYTMPSAGNGSSVADVRYYGARWRLALTPDRAQGILGGYMDINDWNAAANQGRSTHHQAYGQAATPSIYRAMIKNADYADPKTGAMIGISTAFKVGLTQVFVTHPDMAVSANTAAPATATSISRD